MKRLLPLLALLLAACAAPRHEDVAAMRRAVEKFDEALALEEQVRQQNLDVLEAALVRAVEGEVRQAVLDDLRRLEAEGKFNREAVAELQAAADVKRLKNLADVRALVRGARDAQVYGELREIAAALRAWILARVDDDERKAQILDLLHEAGRKTGILKGGTDGP